MIIILTWEQFTFRSYARIVSSNLFGRLSISLILAATRVVSFANLRIVNLCLPITTLPLEVFSDFFVLYRSLYDVFFIKVEQYRLQDTFLPHPSTCLEYTVIQVHSVLSVLVKVFNQCKLCSILAHPFLLYCP